MVLGNYYLTMDPAADIISRKADAGKYRYWENIKGKGLKIGVAFNTSGAQWVDHNELFTDNEVTIFTGTDAEHVEGQKPGKPTPGEINLFNALLNKDIDIAIYNGYDFNQLAAKRKEYAKFEIAILTERRLVSDMDEVEYLYALGNVTLHTPILLGNYYDTLPAQPKTQITTIDRAIANRSLPDEMRFVQDTMGKKQLQTLVATSYQLMGGDTTTDIVDAIKNLGFHYATVSGTTIAVSDLTVPVERGGILAKASGEIEQSERDFRRGLLTEDERYQKTVDPSPDPKTRLLHFIKNTLDPFGPIAIMAISGSPKGGFGPITQLSGMRGLMADPSGRIIDLPIRSHFRMGLTALEYFISTHGARKGLADTALRTGDAGYLTRRLVDVAQDVIVNRLDCYTEQGMIVRKADNIAGQMLQERIVGRCASHPHSHPTTGEMIVDRNG